MFYEGMPLQAFLIQKAQESNLTVSEFEQFIIDSNFDGVKIINIDKDIKQFKVQANFWGSAIIINESDRKVGWKPFVLKYKKAKQKVRDFYLGHPKLYR